MIWVCSNVCVGGDLERISHFVVGSEREREREDEKLVDRLKKFCATFCGSGLEKVVSL